MTPAATPSSRLAGIDALRGLAVLLMIEQHMGVWLWAGIGKTTQTAIEWPLVAFNALGGVAAPTFIALAGVGTSLLVLRRRGEGLDALLVRRGIVLLALGVLLDLITPSWFTWGSWFVLHLMGFAIATAPLWRRMSSAALLTMAAAAIVAAPILQLALDTPTALNNARMGDVTLPGSPWRLWLAEGQFPIAPWLGPFLAGMFAGRLVHAGRLRDLARMAVASLSIGAIATAAWLAADEPDRTAPINRALGLDLGFFPASITIVALLLGTSLLLLFAVLAFERRRPLGDRHPMVCLGRASLTLLLVHVPLFRELSRPLGLWHGLSAGATLATIFGFLALAIVAARLWRRIGYRYGAEWLLREIAGN